MNKTNNSKQAFWVALGSVISYSFILITSMILSRYFAKGDYGIYKQVMYVYNSLLVIFTLGLPRAYSYFLPRVPLAEAKDTIKKITNLFFLLGIIFSLALFFCSPLIALVLKSPDLEYALKWFSLVPLFMLPTMGIDGILATYQRTQFIAIYKGLSSMFQLLCVSIPVIFFDGTYISAIVGFTLSSFLIFIVALYLKNMPIRKAPKSKSSITYKAVFRFSLPLLYASLWGVLMNAADQFFISRYFGKEVFAEFSNGWLDLPFISMIVGATSIVLLPAFSKMINEDEKAYEQIRLIWTNVFSKTAKIVYPLLIYCWFFADIIMIVLYGNNYSNSGIYFRIRLVMNLLSLIAYGPLMLAMGATKHYAKGIAYGAISLVLLEFVLVTIFHSPYVVAIASVLCHIGVVFFMLFYVANFLHITLINLFPLKLMIKILFSSILILLVLYYLFVVFLDLDNLLILSASFIIYILLYLLNSFFMKIDYLSVVKPLVRKKQ